MKDKAIKTEIRKLKKNHNIRLKSKIIRNRQIQILVFKNINLK